jgi:hypothetical protein
MNGPDEHFVVWLCLIAIGTSGLFVMQRYVKAAVLRKQHRDASEKYGKMIRGWPAWFMGLIWGFFALIFAGVFGLIGLG